MRFVKVQEVLVVHKDVNRVASAKEEMVEMTEGADDGIEFAVEDVVVDLGWLKGGRKEGNGVFEAIRTDLT